MVLPGLLPISNRFPRQPELYLTAVAGFYEFVAAERLAHINLPRMCLLIRQRSRRPGVRLPQFPADDIRPIISFMLDPVKSLPTEGDNPDNERLRAMRDAAFLLTLADTGLRVHEARALRRVTLIGTKAGQS